MHGRARPRTAVLQREFRVVLWITAVHSRARPQSKSHLSELTIAHGRARPRTAVLQREFRVVIWITAAHGRARPRSPTDCPGASSHTHALNRIRRKMYSKKVLRETTQQKNVIRVSCCTKSVVFTKYQAIHSNAVRELLSCTRKNRGAFLC